MRRHEKLQAELAAALVSKSQARDALAQCKTNANEARRVFAERTEAVEEVEVEIENGGTGRALLNAEAEALRAKSEAREFWTVRKGLMLQARGKFKECLSLVEEVRGEIETGTTGRPLIDVLEAKAEEAEAKEAPGPTPPKSATRKAKAAKQDPKLAGLKFPTAAAIIAEQTAQEAPGTPPEPPRPAAVQTPTPPASDSGHGHLGHHTANGTGFTTPPTLAVAPIPPEYQRPESPEDRRPIRRQTGRGPR